MKTYQDLVKARENGELFDFLQNAVSDYKSSEFYQTAFAADQYYRHLNPTIVEFQKVVYNLMGKAVPDVWSANNKIRCRYYFYFITQGVQYLLGNGVSFGKPETKEKLGNNFDNAVQKITTDAVNAGVAFGFWNLDHLENFSALEFMPLYDEETGALRSGIRWWQISSEKPLRITLYEEDGYTDYIKKPEDKKPVEMQEKQSYIKTTESSQATGIKTYDGGNYPSFPIVPLFNTSKQSELVGNRETIDAYDLMSSGLINNIDDANVIYWVIKNAGGMTDADDARFVQRLKTLHVAHTDDDTSVDAHSVEVPFQASETALNQLREELFEDFMALDVKNIASGAATATQIRAAYEPLNSKTDLLEAHVTEFISSVLSLIKIDDAPTYTRSKIVNTQEEIQTLVLAQSALSQEYVTNKILEILGDIDKIEEVTKQKMAEDLTRFNNNPDEDEEI